MTGHSISEIQALIAQRQSERAMSDQQLAAAIGYSNGRVMQMIRQGAMKLPLNKCKQLATVLEIDTWAVVKLALADSPDLYQAIRDLSEIGKLSDAEVNLIHEIRKLAGDKAISPVVFNEDVIAVVALR